MSNNDAILKTYVSNDLLRPALCVPFTWEGYEGATDGHTAIFIPAAESSYKRFGIDTYKFETIFPERGVERHINVNDLRDKVASAPLVDETIEIKGKCTNCHGTGQYECDECGQDAPCPECDGTGEGIEEKPTGKKIPHPLSPIDMNGAHFMLRLVSRLIATAEHFVVDEIVWTHEPRKLAPNEFLIGPARVIVMPMRAEEPRNE